MLQGCKHIRIEGRVQGVGFRAATKREADRLGLCGWVRNVDRGAVEVLVWGDQASLDQLVRWIHQGPPSAAVKQVVCNEGTRDAALSSFQIRYTGSP